MGASALFLDSSELLLQLVVAKISAEKNLVEDHPRTCRVGCNGH